MINMRNKEVISWLFGRIGKSVCDSYGVRTAYVTAIARGGVGRACFCFVFLVLKYLMFSVVIRVKH